MIAERWPQAFAGDIAVPGRNHMTICDAFAEPGHPLFETTVRLCASV